MSHYLDEGYLTATFHATAQPVPNDPHKFDVVYEIEEGPQVKANNIISIGKIHTHEALIAKETQPIQPGKPLSERKKFESETSPAVFSLLSERKKLEPETRRE